MNNNLKKYLKYKNKYLDLKKQLGGSGTDSPKPRPRIVFRRKDDGTGAVTRESRDEGTGSGSGSGAGASGAGTGAGASGSVTREELNYNVIIKNSINLCTIPTEFDKILNKYFDDNLDKMLWSIFSIEVFKTLQRNFESDLFAHLGINNIIPRLTMQTKSYNVKVILHRDYLEFCYFKPIKLVYMPIPTEQSDPTQREPEPEEKDSLIKYELKIPFNEFKDFPKKLDKTSIDLWYATNMDKFKLNIFLEKILNFNKDGYIDLNINYTLSRDLYPESQLLRELNNTVLYNLNDNSNHLGEILGLFNDEFNNIESMRSILQKYTIYSLLELLSNRPNITEDFELVF
jgi:uncharacterized protein YjgD (DUF1641 family)